MKNKSIEITMTDGNKVELTITFGLLYQLRAKKEKEFEAYNEIVMNGVKDMMNYPEALYAGYLCKCIEDEAEPEMSKEEFVAKLPYSIGEVVDAYRELCNAGKKLLLGDHLKPKQDK